MPLEETLRGCDGQFGQRVSVVGEEALYYIYIDWE